LTFLTATDKYIARLVIVPMLSVFGDRGVAACAR